MHLRRNRCQASIIDENISLKPGGDTRLSNSPKIDLRRGIRIIVQDLFFVCRESYVIHTREFFDAPIDPAITPLPRPGLGERDRVLDRDVDEKIIVSIAPDALEHA